MTGNEVEQAPRGVRRWRDRAACRWVDPELFFPAAERGPAREVQEAAAKAVCRRCPVRDVCLEWALDGLSDGVAGGLNEDERRALRRDTGRRAAAGPVRSPAAELVEVPTSGGQRARSAAGQAASISGEPATSVADRFGVPVNHVYTWRTRARRAQGRARHDHVGPDVPAA